MLVDNEFTVDAPPADVYALMLDVERVAPCLPGTAVLGRRDDGGYDGELSLKLGPMKMRYRGTVAITAHDPRSLTATMLAKGVEARGQGSAQGELAMAVRPGAGGGAAVSVSTTISVTGRVAQMGQGIMQDVASRLVSDMASNMETLLAAAAPARRERSSLRLGALLAMIVRGRFVALRRAWGQR